MRTAVLIVGLALAAPRAAHSQSVISLRAGLLNYSEGRLETSDPVASAPLVGVFHLRAGQQLQTRRGRAELLLAPSVFLRLAEESLIAMENDTLSGVEVSLLRGSAVIDAVDLARDSRVRVRLGSAVAELSQAGIYRFDAASGEIRVFDGKATVDRSGARIMLKKGRLLAVNSSAQPAGFDRKAIDRIQRWSARRSLAVAQSNLVLARSNYGRGWRRIARVWIWSLYTNAEAARSSVQPVPTG